MDIRAGDRNDRMSLLPQHLHPKDLASMIRRHLVAHLRHVNDVVDVLKFTPGDLVRIHDQPKTIGLIIEVGHNKFVTDVCDQPAIADIQIARVMWAVEPPETYSYRPQQWTDAASYVETGYVYAPYVPLKVTPTIYSTVRYKKV